MRLSRLYRSSVALVYPSHYEGFGLPLIEAMSCNTPVLATNCSCIPEIVGDAALLVDPNSETDLTEGMNTLLNNPQRRNRLVEKGRMRCRSFSWAKSVQDTMDVYRSVVERARSATKNIAPITPSLSNGSRQPQIALPYATVSRCVPVDQLG